MKKNIALLVCIALVCAATFAQNAASDFAIDSNGVITKYKGWDAAVVIPEKINGISVTAIGNKAFINNQLTSVTIGSNVNIGFQAFYMNLKSLYEANGKAAGTYILDKNYNWTKQ
jgi:hypothetical protein